MAHYLVRARLRPELAEELREKLRRREFLALKPFGQALTHALEGARRDPATGEAVWEEEDYCTPPWSGRRSWTGTSWTSGWSGWRKGKALGGSPTCPRFGNPRTAKGSSS